MTKLYLPGSCAVRGTSTFHCRNHISENSPSPRIVGNNAKYHYVPNGNDSEIRLRVGEEWLTLSHGNWIYNSDFLSMKP